MLVACRTWGVESENRPQRGQFLPDLQAHSRAMGQKAGGKCSTAVDLQQATPKSDRLLGTAVERTRGGSRIVGVEPGAVFHSIWNIKPRLLRLLRLALAHHASFLWVPSRVEHCNRSWIGLCLIALTALLRTLRTGPPCHRVLLASFLATPSGESWCRPWSEYRGGT